MTKTASRLFIYGTLMSTAQGALGKAQRDRLAREARFLGPATMPGARLYDLGRYPGLIETFDKTHIVHGEVVELSNPVRTFTWLDDYEGIVPADQDHNEYERDLRPIMLTGGEVVQAWVYLYRSNVPHHAHIRSGHWSKSPKR